MTSCRSFILFGGAGGLLVEAGYRCWHIIIRIFQWVVSGKITQSESIGSMAIFLSTKKAGTRKRRPRNMSEEISVELFLLRFFCLFLGRLFYRFLHGLFNRFLIRFFLGRLGLLFAFYSNAAD